MNAHEYYRWAKFNWWNYKLFAIQLAKFKKARKILDVGCGNGLLLDELRIFFPNAIIVGLDSSKDMLIVKKQTNVILGKAECLPFKNDFFDIVTCMYSLHEFDLSAIDEIRRVLKTGGLLVVKEINCSAPKWALMHLKILLRMFFDEKTVKKHMDLYQTFHSPEKLIRFLEKSGFEVLKVNKSILDFSVFCRKC